MGRIAAYLASKNAHKLAELRAALPAWQIDLLAAGQFPPEQGVSYYENARVKAEFGRSAGPRDAWILGEDSGIEVEALGGAPGVRSARWAGEADPVEALLSRLGGFAAGERRARYVCELVCVSPAGNEFRGTGILPGRVGDEPRGSEGFGYDPIFVPDGENRTVAELGDRWKREHSHRARAARALATAIAFART